MENRNQQTSAQGDASLDALRADIDRIDNEPVRLFTERMKVSAAIADRKRASGRPGTLCRILTCFAEQEINLIQMESHPVSGHESGLMFYFDAEVPAASDKLPQLLPQLEAECGQFRFPGAYMEVV